MLAKKNSIDRTRLRSYKLLHKKKQFYDSSSAPTIGSPNIFPAPLPWELEAECSSDTLSFRHTPPHSKHKSIINSRLSICISSRETKERTITKCVVARSYLAAPILRSPMHLAW
jgi:hypothetical protein